MHRTRLSVLVILAALTACSTRDELLATELLSQDPTLVARLESDQPTGHLPVPDACGAFSVAAQAPAPAADTNRFDADELTRQAYDAGTLGRLEEARALLRRASELDGTNKSAAYHLGRTSEALGDRAGALTAYCRYLTLTPTLAEAAEARQRVATLSQPELGAAAGSVRDSAPARRRDVASTAGRVARARRAVAPPAVASAAVERSSPAVSAERSGHAANATAGDVAGGAADAPPSRDQMPTSSQVDRGTDSAVAGGDVVTTVGPVAADEVHQPATAARTERRGPSRAQRAGIGAATGAIIGAVTGRSVKGAVIGAAAGGVLGTVLGGGALPVGRGIRP